MFMYAFTHYRKHSTQCRSSNDLHLYPVDNDVVSSSSGLAWTFVAIQTSRWCRLLPCPVGLPKRPIEIVMGTSIKAKQRRHRDIKTRGSPGSKRMCCLGEARWILGGTLSRGKVDVNAQQSVTPICDTDPQSTIGSTC
ncbi:hypothetical protein PM082_006250 [Marasmius tenuissimus]|nr:hypothetical protein PM082_006250 [Marasmius tenuissimus]